MRRESNLAALTPEQRADEVQEQVQKIAGSLTDETLTQPVKVAKPKVTGLSKEEKRLSLRQQIIQGIDDAKNNGNISNPSAPTLVVTTAFR
jgi:hypothetical protein